MRVQWIIACASLTLLAGMTVRPAAPRLNGVVELLERKQPVFGLYAPANSRGRGAAAEPARTPAELVQTAKSNATADFLFDGSMEGNFEGGLATYSAFVDALAAAGPVERGSPARLWRPLFVKTPEIAPDPALATRRIGQQLNLGTSGIVMVGVASAAEVAAGLAAMRFPSSGGTRTEDVGRAPAFWGMSEADYRRKADVWPLNPEGELVAWVIVESKAGLARLDEIAAVKGIGTLFPGAGTLRGVFTTTGANGERVFDETAWEAAIQQVLAACKRHGVACGYPANASDIERRMQQGFSVFIMGWGEQGFTAIDLGRRASGRTAGGAR